MIKGLRGKICFYLTTSVLPSSVFFAVGMVTTGSNNHLIIFTTRTFRTLPVKNIIKTIHVTGPRAIGGNGSGPAVEIPYTILFAIIMLADPFRDVLLHWTLEI